MTTIGVLALQGDFESHLVMLRRLGVSVREVRRQAELEGLSGLIIPGGESTVMHRLAAEYGLEEPIVSAIHGGLPVFGTCAGAILLGRASEVRPPRWAAIDISTERNAYGRQKESCTLRLPLTSIGEFECVFIRAPRLFDPGPGVTVLGRRGDDIILAREKNVLVATFHPELTEDHRLHRYFLREVVGAELAV
ncbi:MAG: pyridoxal 5'-phosphate synthase glutaminase subunit PdxT [Planctomycetota bacterium]